MKPHEWVIGETCRQIAAWRREGFDVPRVAVHLGARHCQHPRLADHIRELLAHHGVDGGALELEITETTAMHRRRGHRARGRPARRRRGVTRAPS